MWSVRSGLDSFGVLNVMCDLEMLEFRCDKLLSVWNRKGSSKMIRIFLYGWDFRVDYF